MSNTILLFSTLFLMNSCCGTNKTISDSSFEKTQKSESIETENVIINDSKTINLSDSIPKITETHLVAEVKPEEAKIKIVDAIKTFNHNSWNDLLQKYVSSRGNVNYKDFKTDETKLDDYLVLLSKNKPSSSSSKNEKLAYWINAYNAFTIKLILDNYPIKSIKDIKKPWDKEFITIDGESISLSHIEHEILRKMNEPRIHFAIVCASVSCPKLQNTAFKSSTIETQLTTASKEFLADPSRNNIAQNRIEISKIFSWFSSDFKQNGSLIDFLNKYSEIAISQKASKSYKDYNWNLNE